MTKETQFEKRAWAKGDRPGASDFNRIEGGIESAHERVDQLVQVVADNATAQATVNSRSLEVTFPVEAIAELVKQIPKLEANAKVADVAQAFNALHDALTGAVDENQNDGAD